MAETITSVSDTSMAAVTTTALGRRSTNTWLRSLPGVSDVDHDEARDQDDDADQEEEHGADHALDEHVWIDVAELERRPGH